MCRWNFCGLLILVMLLAGGCAAGDSRGIPQQIEQQPDHTALPQQSAPEGTGASAPEGSAGTIDIDAALREIAELDTPGDVDEQVFAELKAELARLLGERVAGRKSVGELHVQSTRYSSETTIRKSKYVPEPFQTRINRTDNRLSWHYILEGDYDQNGVVTAADIVPLAGHIGDIAGSGGLDDYFDIGTMEYVIDRNGDGFITFADLTAIAVNYGREAGDYRVYASEDWRDVPWKPDKDSDYVVPDVAPRGSVNLSAAVKSTGGQLYFNIPMTDTDVSFLWLLRGEGPQLERSPVAWPGYPFSDRYSPVTPFRIRETGLLYDSASNSIGMLPILPGDGDRNGFLSVADITPVGIHLGTAANADLPLRGYHIADYDLNGMINLDDLRPLGVLHGSFCAGFGLFYAEGEEELPGSFWEGEQKEPVLTIYRDALEYPQDWHPYYIPEQIRELPFVPEPGSWLYLRPVSHDSFQFGPVCEFVQVS